MVRPFKELQDEVMADPKRAAAVDEEKKLILADQDRYEKDESFRARLDCLIEEEKRVFKRLVTE
ncbi:MAG: hypothetical protein JJE13_04310 [Thermoleophilia bacterium]|nr:hypothetical protein [Thermoleophilia bacterium]